MKRIYSFFLFLTLIFFAVNPALSQTQRIIGGSQLDLDDNAGSHIFLSDASSSLGINSTGIPPNTCALLDLTSTTKGLLVPRMTALEELALCGGTPPEGLIVYNTTSHTLDIFNGTIWGTTAGWALTGNTGTNPAINFLGTIDPQDLVIKTNSTEAVRVQSGGNVGIGIASPFAQLQVQRTLTNPSFAGSNIGTYTVNNFNPSGATSVRSFGSYSEAHVNSASSLGTATIDGTGGDAEIDAASTFAPATVIGTSGIAVNNASVTAPSVEGVRGQAYANGGNIADAIGLNSLSFVGAGANIGTLHGVHISDVSNLGGSVTDQIGVDIDQLSAASNNTAFRYNHATQPVIISGAGNVQIGSLSSAFGAGLITDRTSTATSGGAQIADEAQMIVKPSGTSNLEYIGNYSHVDAANTNATTGGAMYGLWGGAELSPAATASIFAARGVLGELSYQTTQPLFDGASVAGLLDVEAAGSISTASAFRASFVQNAPGTITDLKLLNVLDLFTNNGTITNTYGLYIGNLTLGTQTNKPYSIYVSDGNSQSFFNGKSGFGSGTFPAFNPQTSVDIAGALTIEYSGTGHGIFPAGTDIDPNFSGEEGYTYIGGNAGGILNGIQNGTNGRILIVHKTGTAITISNEDPGAPAGDRIHCVSGGSPVIPAGEAIITFIYEGASGLNRWLILSVNTAY